MATPGTAISQETLRALNKLASGKGGKVGSKPVASSLSDADVAEMKKVIRRHKQCTDRLDRIQKGGSKAKFEHTRDRYLTAFPTRLSATIRAFAKKRPGASRAAIYKFAHDVDAWQPLREEVRVEVTPKSKGGYRRISKDGIRRTAQRLIVRDLLTVAGIDNEHDYTRRGAGGEKQMIRDVCQRIEKKYRHWQTADVVNCFASLSPAHLAWLPIPKKLLRNVVFLPECARVRFTGKLGVLRQHITELACEVTGDTASLSFIEALSSSTRKVRRELPQGSVLSPLVARAAVGRELRAVLGTHKVVPFCYIDDLTLGARSQLEVEEAFEALQARLNGHPAGPILLRIDPPTPNKHGRISVFGYVLEPGRGYGDNYVHVRPGFERFQRFHRKTYERWKAEGKPGGIMGLEDYIRPLLARWMPSQSAWTIVPVHNEDLALSYATIDICDWDSEEFKKSAGT